MEWKRGHNTTARHKMRQLINDQWRYTPKYIAMLLPYTFVHAIRRLVSCRAFFTYD